MNDPALAAEQLWLGGRPLEAGRALAALVPEAERSAWAGRVLAWTYTRSKIAPDPAVAAVIVAARDRASGASEALALIDAALEREEHSGRFDSLREAVLTLARNAARLLPGAQPDPPDPRLAWRFVASLKCVGDEFFAAEAWPHLARFR